MDFASSSTRRSFRFSVIGSKGLAVSRTIQIVDRRIPWPLAAMAAADEWREPDGGSRGDRLALHGRKILVVEDESLIALLIMDALEEAGACVVGPCYSLSECMKAAQTEGIDGAVLDVDLAGSDVFPAADVLRERGIPFVFHTGHADREELRARFGEVAVCRKPIDMEHLLQVLSRATAPRAN